MDAVSQTSAPIDLIYLDPEITDFHAGHVRIFAARAGADERIASLHFALTPVAAETGAEIAFDDRFATEDEIVDALIQCDVMLATRRNHPGVSNAMIWAAAAGRPTISQASGWMGHVTVRERLGLVCDPLDPGAIAAAMERALDPAWRAAFDATAARAFAARYTADGYYETIVSTLAACHRRG